MALFVISGISLASTKDQMLRAVLESVAFSQKQLVDAFLSETDYKFEKLVVDGGVAQNDFILTLIANLTGIDGRPWPCYSSNTFIH